MAEKKSYQLKIFVFLVVFCLLIGPSITSAFGSLSKDSIDIIIHDEFGDTIFSESGKVEFEFHTFIELSPGLFLVFTIFEDGLVYFDYFNDNDFAVEVPIHHVWLEDLQWTDRSGKVVDFEIIHSESGAITVDGVTKDSVHFSVDSFELEAFGNFFHDLQIISIHFDKTVSGEYLPIDSTALFLAGLSSNAVWMIPVLVGIAGAGVLIRKKRN